MTPFLFLNGFISKSLSCILGNPEQLDPRLSAPWRFFYFLCLTNMYSGKIITGPTRDRGKFESGTSLWYFYSVPQRYVCSS